MAPYLKATNTVVSASLKPLAAATILPSEDVAEKPAIQLSSYKSGPIGSISVLSGIGGLYKLIIQTKLNAQKIRIM